MLLNFVYGGSNLLDCAVAAHIKMYTTGLTILSTRSSHSAFCSHASNNFYRGSKSVKCGLDLWNRLSLSHCHSETKQRISTKVSCLVKWSCSSVLPKFGAVWSPLWGVEFGSRPPWNKFEKSSITQLEMVPFCSNLVGKLSVSQPGIVQFRSDS